MAKKKVKKPGKLMWKGDVIAEIEHDCMIFVEGFRDNYTDFSFSKAVHIWLGQALAYLESK